MSKYDNIENNSEIYKIIQEKFPQVSNSKLTDSERKYNIEEAKVEETKYEEPIYLEDKIYDFIQTETKNWQENPNLQNETKNNVVILSPSISETIVVNGRTECYKILKGSTMKKNAEKFIPDEEQIKMLLQPCCEKNHSKKEKTNHYRYDSENIIKEFRNQDNQKNLPNNTYKKFVNSVNINNPNYNINHKSKGRVNKISNTTIAGNIPYNMNNINNRNIIKNNNNLAEIKESKEEEKFNPSINKGQELDIYKQSNISQIQEGDIIVKSNKSSSQKSNLIEKSYKSLTQEGDIIEKSNKSSSKKSNFIEKSKKSLTQEGDIIEKSYKSSIKEGGINQIISHNPIMNDDDLNKIFENLPTERTEIINNPHSNNSSNKTNSTIKNKTSLNSNHNSKLNNSEQIILNDIFGEGTQYKTQYLGDNNQESNGDTKINSNNNKYEGSFAKITRINESNEFNNNRQMDNMFNIYNKSQNQIGNIPSKKIIKTSFPTESNPGNFISQLPLNPFANLNFCNNSELPIQ